MARHRACTLGEDRSGVGTGGPVGLSEDSRLAQLLYKAMLLNYMGRIEGAYAALEKARKVVEWNDDLARKWFYTVVYFQGVTALRRGEAENCVRCRGESSCILPIAKSALRANPGGSRLAIRHFGEYLDQFPDDFAVRWLLNVAHMTLGEHPAGIDPRRVVSIDRFVQSESDIGCFRDVGALVGINAINEAGSSILDDFDGYDRLDILLTTWDAAKPVRLYRNTGSGRFEDVTAKAGLGAQLGGLGCVQADFDNDGHLDLYLPRGAWIDRAIRPSLMRNNGNGTFTDVTQQAGMLDPLNSDTCQWADFDNDGHLDLFVACERQPVKLYRNRGNGTFQDVAEKAGLSGHRGIWKGCNWLDFDNDRFPDLFLNDYGGTAKLFHNNRNGTFTDVTSAMGIDGPAKGLSCWAWDYDNDGWIDIFATCFEESTETVVAGILGQPFKSETTRLYRNIGGTKFQDVSKEAGVALVFAAMGTNFGDFDNDGWLDVYLGTGNHDLGTLVPNRMLRNVDGKRFADITGSSGTGNLQKGHGVSIGDWDRDGAVDIFIQMGGASPGDAYHNLLFRNPGQRNNWLNLKLAGKKSNRSAIGASITLVTSGPNPRTIHRHVSSGSSFGANPLEQHMGVGTAESIERLEIFWPASGTTQMFRDLKPNQAIHIEEFATDYRRREYKRIPLPE
ncbi:MAG: CRTAC1 family protein [Gemmataceae bacterium]